MKIKEIRLSYGETKQLEKKKHRRPRKPFFLIGALVRLLSLPTLWKTKFSFDASGLKRAGKGPYLSLRKKRKDLSCRERELKKISKFGCSNII